MGNTKESFFERHGSVLEAGAFFSYRGWVYRVIAADGGGKWYETYARAASGNDAFTASEIAEALNLYRKASKETGHA